ncbi:alkaline phosphatase family protein [Nocardioides sambongensis]|uniref:alkaline phosphatase family protein n=1 Tax=Nocardioides sambongensis TaxID=2589074 RepID=UPI0015E857AE|nr:alkaline phosphatase family protein [Nocardioides sambongensis]
MLAISVDGLNPTALRRLGRSRTPALHRLLRNGAATTNARTQVESTSTLPNHTSMVTGRRVAAARGGHGVTWNTDRPGTTVEKASGDPRVGSVFSVVHAAGGRNAVFAAKSKFSLFSRSWPAAVDREVIRHGKDRQVARALRRDLARRTRAFTFWHLGMVDRAGHARGWMSRPYLRAVRRADTMIGSVLRVLRKRQITDLRIVLTADHGGRPGTRHHEAIRNRHNYRVPFVVWGPGVDAVRLYRANPDRRRDPRTRRPRFRGRQPVRNGELANVALDLLGLGPVPRSRWDRRQDLRWVDR